MAQEVVNSSANINIANHLSLWFNKDWGTATNSWKEFGDLYVDGVSVTPEWAEHRSYRNGRNSLRKRLLTAQNCTVTATLNEPNIVNFQRLLYGGDVNTSDSVVVYEGKHLELKTASPDGAPGVEYFDIEGDASEDSSMIPTSASYTVTGVYATTDVTEATNLISANVSVNTDGHAHLLLTGETDLEVGTTYYVKYQYTKSSMMSTEIYGATNSTIEGSARLQAPNTLGGTVQIWDLASVNVAPNGDIGYPLDAIQQIPLILTLQERNGTWGTIYTA